MSKSHYERPRVLAAVPTPFTENGALDFTAVAELYAAVASSSVDGMFVGGTTGEFPTLSMEERKLLVEIALENGDNASIFPNVGAASAWEATQLTSHAVESGAIQVAAVTPYYYAAGNSELEEYYKKVAEAAQGCGVYGYSIPSRAGNRIDGELLKRLMEIPNFMGVKVSIPGAQAVRELVEASGGNLRIYVGDDASVLEGLRAGGSGMVTGPGSAIPAPYTALADAMAAGDEERLLEAQALITMLAQNIGGDVGLIKLSLDIQGLPGGNTRAPLPIPSKEDRIRVERSVEKVAEVLGKARWGAEHAS